MNIEIKNLSFKYNKNNQNLILNNVNLSFKEGTVNVLLGLNGCGKTTLLKLLAGLEKPLSGVIEYGEKDLSNISIKERSKIFSYVPQNSYVVGDIPVYDFLLFGVANTLTFYQKPKVKDVEKIKELAEKLNITCLLEKKLGEISGGEKQIVFIACALIQDTPIILLDEPTSALDIRNQNIVLTLLKEISKKGKMIILSSHNPNQALFLDSYVALIDRFGNFIQDSAKNLITVEKLIPIYGKHLCYSDNQPYREVSFK